MGSYQTPQDEGYSEDPLTMQTSASGRRSIMEADVQAWLSELPVAERARTYLPALFCCFRKLADGDNLEGFALVVINGLPTSAVSRIVEAQRPRLFINFFDRLPAEVCLKILGYLDPLSLIHTAHAARDWMSLALDWKLWENLYYAEGWRIIPSELTAFEAELAKRQTLPARTRPSFDLGDAHAHKKRATGGLVTASIHSNEDVEMADADTIGPIKQDSIFGDSGLGHTRSPSFDAALKKIREAPGSQGYTPQAVDARVPGSSDRKSSRSSWTGDKPKLSFLSSLTVRDRRTNARKVNWQYLYTQRRRLESNWEQEKYVNFQLPHPHHLDEMHEECIYTIQHSGKYLVSGSRDRTLRIWNLDTRRLVRPPLRGHKGSVLCLQFDADPAEDLIVSGSSDSTVMLWRFSTGEHLQTLKTAHRESVLNVRFDHRILVTCSKDKTIKIFNRRPLRYGDVGYPSGQPGFGPVPVVVDNYGFTPSPMADMPIQPPYTMIGCLDGHGAAVNAVQIHGNEIVSASGDRHVKVWDWPQQTCTRTLVGHQKGIACVQYDGRRIVSGSSDNEVKVFDKATGLEVASLRGHTNLVRTVQAGFGDLPYSAEEDQAEARQVDDEYFKAVDSGAVPRTQQRRRSRNAGSRKPEDIMAYGAKLPPGGGGGKYGRIVSGSYDETIIIWRRDKEGVWKAQHTLRQEDAAQAAQREFEVPPPQSENSGNSQPGSGPANNGPPPQGGQAFYHNIIITVVPQGPAALQRALQQHPHIIQYHPLLTSAIAAEPNPQIRHSLRAVVAAHVAHHQLQLAQQFQAANTGVPNVAPNLTYPGAGMGNAAHHPHPPAGAATVPIPAAPQAPAMPLFPATAALLPAPPVPPANQVPPHLMPASMARVFKLQFDARRIICCSQTAVIVGWDFANNDEKIIEASRFFAPIE
jgi:F-box and WD-40 domain protein 1/11